MTKSSINIVLPVFSPPKGWAKQCLQHKELLEQKLGEAVELVIVNDGSDPSIEFPEIEGKAKVIHLPKNTGKGAALRAGFSQTEAPFTVFTDADFPYTIDSIAAVVSSLKNGADVALGYRQQDYYASVPWFRKGLSEAFRWVLKDVLNFPITDTQCGLKGMSAKGKEVFLHTKINRFLVDMEFIQLASRDQQLKVEPVVVRLRENIEFSSMGVAVLLPELINFFRILSR